MDNGNWISFNDAIPEIGKYIYFTDGKNIEIIKATLLYHLKNKDCFWAHVFIPDIPKKKVLTIDEQLEDLLDRVKALEKERL